MSIYGVSVASDGGMQREALEGAEQGSATTEAKARTIFAFAKSPLERRVRKHPLLTCHHFDSSSSIRHMF